MRIIIKMLQYFFIINNLSPTLDSLAFQKPVHISAYHTSLLLCNTTFFLFLFVFVDSNWNFHGKDSIL